MHIVSAVLEQVGDAVLRLPRHPGAQILPASGLSLAAAHALDADLVLVVLLHRGDQGDPIPALNQLHRQAEPRIDEHVQYVISAVVSGPQQVLRHEGVEHELHVAGGGLAPGTRDGLKNGKFQYKGEELSLADANQARSTWDNAWVLQTDLVDMRTTLPIKKALEMMERIELISRLLVEEFGFPPIPKERQLKFRWFAKRDQYVKAVPESYQGGMNHYSSFTAFSYAPRGLDPACLVVGTLYEAWLEFHTSLPKQMAIIDKGPLWLVYGMAYFLDGIVQDDKGEFVVDKKRLGSLCRSHCRGAIRKHGDELFTKLASVTFDDIIKTGLNPWIDLGAVLCAMLYEDKGEGRRHLQKMVEAMLKGEGSPDLMLKTTGKPLESFRESFTKYARLRTRT